MGAFERIERNLDAGSDLPARQGSSLLSRGGSSCFLVW